MNVRCAISAIFIYCISAVPSGLAYDQNPLVIKLDIPAAKDTAGGIIVADVNGDGQQDFLVTTSGHLGVYDNSGRNLWIEKTDLVVSVKSETNGLPGHHGPGVAAGDVDGDGRCEVVFLTRDGVLHVLDGTTGDEKATAKPPVPDGAARWELAMITDFRGHGGDRDILWRNHFRSQEPQNAAVGRFKSDSDEVFIWCRSRYNTHQKPFVFNSQGEKVFDYAMDDVAPPGWTDSGVEVIHTIDWTGAPQQLACAKERHTSGDVCVFEPLTGKFVLRLKEKADRLYVADVTGDWREEIIVLNRNELHVYRNKAPNPRPDEERLWENRNYRRLKQCHNYYSP